MRFCGRFDLGVSQPEPTTELMGPFIEDLNVLLFHTVDVLLERVVEVLADSTQLLKFRF